MEKKEQLLTSRENDLVKYCTKLKKGRSFRYSEKKFLLEGVRLCYDSFCNGYPIQTLFYTEEALHKNPGQIAQMQLGAECCFRISQPIAEKLSDTPHSQGVFTLCPMKDILRPLIQAPSGKLLVLDSLQDPGNMGTIFRTSEALGLDGLVLTSSCVDPFSPKVLRSAMGAFFTLPIFLAETGLEAVQILHKKQMRCYAALLDSDSVPLPQCDFSQPSAVFIGNEGNGLPPETASACDVKMILPMRGKAESLNAAVCAAICIWEMTRV